MGNLLDLLFMLRTVLPIDLMREMGLHGVLKNLDIVVMDYMLLTMKVT